MTATWVVVGLGNPGPQYERTRHNVGFLVVEEMARRFGVQFARHRRAHADAAEAHAFVGTPDHCRVVLVKSRGYMNESGGPVKAVLDFIKSEDLIVVHDELDIPLGALRIKHGGGDNGHNGLRSLRKSLGHGEFFRVRCGVGRPPGRQDPADYLLSDFRAAERAEVGVMVQEAADATEYLMRNGLEATQSTFNR
ncbi:MAG: aminoacyl-tRNA hydrolase [Actinobacteria bacterium]|nr:aminoacyl-tRNA hydrolase [Actinomycetota bacterium]MCB8997521.1 aminoacyl-tRNA hydrolase [Actinomycetota bacterium]MCB9414796.1 aminoacyl-tRNA hydrolase [Actinomycetota bacterium]MCB9423756.1 aminoacyl-tRNA hydrolase [Actinomycetota bacterium]HRY09282.1 aminoacyl-tRNA hydrolase [Candidatus Nanopelagicales bacterium]